jgi:hypothetical protein
LLEVEDPDFTGLEIPDAERLLDSRAKGCASRGQPATGRERCTVEEMFSRKPLEPSQGPTVERSDEEVRAESRPCDPPSSTVEAKGQDIREDMTTRSPAEIGMSAG